MSVYSMPATRVNDFLDGRSFSYHEAQKCSFDLLSINPVNCDRFRPKIAHSMGELSALLLRSASQSSVNTALSKLSQSDIVARTESGSIDLASACPLPVVKKNNKGWMRSAVDVLFRLFGVKQATAPSPALSKEPIENSLESDLKEFLDKYKEILDRNEKRSLSTSTTDLSEYFRLTKERKSAVNASPEVSLAVSESSPFQQDAAQDTEQTDALSDVCETASIQSDADAESNPAETAKELLKESEAIFLELDACLSGIENKLSSTGRDISRSDSSLLSTGSYFSHSPPLVSSLLSDADSSSSVSSQRVNQRVKQLRERRSSSLDEQSLQQASRQRVEQLGFTVLDQSPVNLENAYDPVKKMSDNQCVYQELFDSTDGSKAKGYYCPLNVNGYKALYFLDGVREKRLSGGNVQIMPVRFDGKFGEDGGGLTGRVITTDDSKKRQAVLPIANGQVMLRQQRFIKFTEL